MAKGRGAGISTTYRVLAARSMGFDPNVVGSRGRCSHLVVGFKQGAQAKEARLLSFGTSTGRAKDGVSRWIAYPSATIVSTSFRTLSFCSAVEARL